MRSERAFYLSMAALILLAVSVGFARSYYLRGLVGPPASPLAPLTSVIHIHGFLFTGWILLLTAQTSLVTAGRRDRWALPPFILRLGAPGVFGLADLALVPLVVWDLTTRGRIDRATLWGGLALVGSLPLRLFVARTDAWVTIADWAVGLVRTRT